jgi:hypothetical protein
MSCRITLWLRGVIHNINKRMFDDDHIIMEKDDDGYSSNMIVKNTDGDYDGKANICYSGIVAL